MEWKLCITDPSQEKRIISLEDMERWKDASVPVEDVVPGKQAEAVYLKKIFEELKIPMKNFTQAKVEAEDGFSQQVDREDLETSFLVYKQKGELLTKGFPARLYVPSAPDCLNVKSVVLIELN